LRRIPSPPDPLEEVIVGRLEGATIPPITSR
jgi:hypothetical protein